MNGGLVLALILLYSSLPAFAVFIWFRAAGYPFSVVRFLLILLIGAAAYFPALIMQSFFPRDFFIAGRLGLIAQIFLPIAFPEELSRLIILLIFFYVVRKIDRAKNADMGFSLNSVDGTTPPASTTGARVTAGYGIAIFGSAAGLIAGFGFALLESTAYGAANTGVALLRLFTAAPIHGACGARTGSAAALFPTHPVQGLFRFITAVIIHGIFNFMVQIPGIASYAAVFIALFSLASVIISIRGGMKSLVKSTSATQTPENIT